MFRVRPTFLLSARRLTTFASLNPKELSGSSPHTVLNLVRGEWRSAASAESIIDPMNGEPFLSVPLTKGEELEPFVAGLKSCPKSGLHNPFLNVERYVMLGRLSATVAARLKEPVVEQFFAQLIQRVAPKSLPQALGEVRVTQKFLENFSGDQVRYLARSFGVSGDHAGQESRGYRFPFGPVAIITPFNFPLEIPALQLFGALYMGNRPTVKVDSKVSVVAEQFLRLLIECGLPASDLDFVNCDGPTMQRLLRLGKPRNTLFTGSSRVGELLCKELKGRIKLEDAGFDWKILGPDVGNVDYVAWQSDQDAYACSGQKCSAQSILFMHRKWAKTDVLEKMKALAARRNLEDLTIGPVLTWTTEAMLGHVSSLLEIPGAKLLWGGKPLVNHSIPARYGAIEPTAVFVPLSQLSKKRNFELCTTEVFGPVQVVTEFSNSGLKRVLGCLERMTHHLTAGIVSNNPTFVNTVLGATVNGTTYIGQRARTTGAPQNHWFGPSGDPRGAGIGTREAIQLVWSSHREVITDTLPLPTSWSVPESTRRTLAELRGGDIYGEFKEERTFARGKREESRPSGSGVPVCVMSLLLTVAEKADGITAAPSSKISPIMGTVEQIRTYDADGFRRRAGCVCFSEDWTQILVIRAANPSRPHWVLPAGGIDPGEDPESAALRETLEEAGAVGDAVAYLGCFEDDTRKTRSEFFVMHQPKLLDTWLEGDQGRIRSWIPVSSAAVEVGGRSVASLAVVQAAVQYVNITLAQKE